jgi:uncharacterized protein YjbI with pentapeptide repeats
MEPATEEKPARLSERAGLVILALVLYGIMTTLFVARAWNEAAPEMISFGPYEATTGQARDTTVWDWLELLIVPAVLASGALLFNRSQKRAEDKRAEQTRELEQDIAADRQQQTALEAYYDRMTKLLLEYKLSEPGVANAKVPVIARAMTLAILKDLNPDRRTQLFRFLEEGDLITPPNPKIILAGVDLAGADLARARLVKAELAKVNLSGANLSEANLTEAIMTEVNLFEAKLSRADLSGAYLYKATAPKADLTGAVLSEAILTGADLSGAILSGANLTGVEMISAQLTGAELIWAKLSDVDLTGVDLSGAFLKNANLAGADLSAADLTGAVLDGAQLARAKYTKITRWPDGFDPVAAGAVLVEEQPSTDG